MLARLALVLVGLAFPACDTEGNPIDTSEPAPGYSTEIARCERSNECWKEGRCGYNPKTHRCVVTEEGCRYSALCYMEGRCTTDRAWPGSCTPTPKGCACSDQCQKKGTGCRMMAGALVCYGAPKPPDDIRCD